ncbi:MAG TPA: diacylglycerol kinase [Opitutales bacterium]|jgi:diacylglycerol kinase (ATP)|nr:diacylglycerol kinase [Opitutales bacterium]
MPISTEREPCPPGTIPDSPESVSDKKPTTLGVRRLVNAFFYSMEGFGSAYKHEEAFRQEIYLALVLMPVAVLLPVDLLGKALMIGSVLLVLIVELLNSAVEWCVDLAAKQQLHPFAKRAKDMGSAAVFLSLLNCLLIWVLVIAQAFATGVLHK